MKKNRVRAVVDILLYLVMSYLLATGLLIHYRLVPGYRGGHGLTLFGLSRHQWGSCHLWFSYLLIVLILVHILLNMAFIRNFICKKRNWRMIAIAMLGVAIVLFFLLMPIERQESGGQGGSHGRGANHHSH